MTHKVGPKGQVVIPKQMRDRLGLAPGDEVTFTLEGDSVLIEPASNTRVLRGRFAGSGMARALSTERKRDREREDRR